MIFGMQVPRLFYYGFRWTQKAFKKEINYFFEFLVAIMMILSSFGGLKYHHGDYEFDSFEHFFLSGLLLIMISLLWAGYLYCTKKASLTTSLVYGILTTVFWLIIWELSEMYLDSKYGVLMFVPEHKPWDVYTDFFWNSIGIALASLVYLRFGDRLFKYFKKGVIEKIVKK